MSSRPYLRERENRLDSSSVKPAELPYRPLIRGDGPALYFCLLFCVDPVVSGTGRAGRPADWGGIVKEKQGGINLHSGRRCIPAYAMHACYLYQPLLRRSSPAHISLERCRG